MTRVMQEDQDIRSDHFACSFYQVPGGKLMGTPAERLAHHPAPAASPGSTNSKADTPPPQTSPLSLEHPFPVPVLLPLLLWFPGRDLLNCGAVVSQLYFSRCSCILQQHHLVSSVNIARVLCRKPAEKMDFPRGLVALCLPCP